MTIPAEAVSRERRWIIVAAWVITTAFVVVSFRFVSWGRALEEMRSATPGWIVVAILSNAAILFIWAVLWRVILPPGRAVSVLRLAEITAVTSTVLNTLPFLIGEATGMVLLSKRAGLGNAAALSVLAVDQLLLGIAKVLLLLLVSVLVPLPYWMREGLGGLSAGVGVLFIVMVIIAHRAKVPKAVDGPARTGRLGFVTRLASDWARGLEGLRSWSRFFGALGLEIAKKSAEMGGIIAVQYAFGQALPLGHSLLVLAALNLVTVLPVSPANLGVYEAAVFFSYRYLGLPESRALGMAVVQHVCYLLPLAGIGYVVLTAKQVSSRRGPFHAS